MVEENAKFFRVYHADSMHLKRVYDIKVRLCISIATQNRTRAAVKNKICMYSVLFSAGTC